MIKKTSSFLLLSFLLTIAQYSFAQDLLTELPNTKESFVASEKKVLATIEWLEITPFEQEQDKRSKQKALLVAWLTNSPTVTLEINADILTFTRHSPPSKYANNIFGHGYREGQ